MLEIKHENNQNIAFMHDKLPDCCRHGLDKSDGLDRDAPTISYFLEAADRFATLNSISAKISGLILMRVLKLSAEDREGYIFSQLSYEINHLPETITIVPAAGLHINSHLNQAFQYLLQAFKNLGHEIIFSRKALNLAIGELRHAQLLLPGANMVNPDDACCSVSSKI